MSDATPELDLSLGAGGARKTRGRAGLWITLLLALFAAGAGFYATWSHKVQLPFLGAGHSPKTQALGFDGLAFVPLEQMVISVAPGGSGRHLRFAAQIETDSAHSAEITQILPRLQDVIHSYLRAVDPKTFDEAGALTKLRAQILRRIQIVTGEDRVRDLLITEFVLT